MWLIEQTEQHLTVAAQAQFKAWLERTDVTPPIMQHSYHMTN